MIPLRLGHQEFSATMIYTHVLNRGQGAGSAARPTGCSYAGLGCQEHDAPEDAMIYGDASRFIAAHGPRGVPRGRGKTGPDGGGRTPSP
jgi:hypothetical protein